MSSDSPSFQNIDLVPGYLHDVAEIIGDLLNVTARLRHRDIDFDPRAAAELIVACHLTYEEKPSSPTDQSPPQSGTPRTQSVKFAQDVLEIVRDHAIFAIEILINCHQRHPWTNEEASDTESDLSTAEVLLHTTQLICDMQRSRRSSSDDLSPEDQSRKMYWDAIIVTVEALQALVTLHFESVKERNASALGGRHVSSSAPMCGMCMAGLGPFSVGDGFPFVTNEDIDRAIKRESEAIDGMLKLCSLSLDIPDNIRGLSTLSASRDSITNAMRAWTPTRARHHSPESK